MMRKLSVLGIGAILALVLSASTAHAAAIKGSVGFGGGFQPTGGTNLGNATGIHFVAPIIVTNPTTGDYAGTAGTAATFTDFTFNPFGGSVTPLWSFSFGGRTYSFDLTSVTVVSQSKTFLNLSGSGILHISGGGFDDTAAIWNFTGTRAGASFSFGSVATAAPEPASTLLLGLALLGGVKAYRRRQTA